MLLQPRPETSDAQVSRRQRQQVFPGLKSRSRRSAGASRHARYPCALPWKENDESLRDQCDGPPRVVGRAARLQVIHIGVLDVLIALPEDADEGTGSARLQDQGAILRQSRNTAQGQRRLCPTAVEPTGSVDIDPPNQGGQDVCGADSTGPSEDPSPQKRQAVLNTTQPFPSEAMERRGAVSWDKRVEGLVLPQAFTSCHYALSVVVREACKDLGKRIPIVKASNADRAGHVLRREPHLGRSSA